MSNLTAPVGRRKSAAASSPPSRYAIRRASDWNRRLLAILEAAHGLLGLLDDLDASSAGEELLDSLIRAGFTDGRGADKDDELVVMETLNDLKGFRWAVELVVGIIDPVTVPPLDSTTTTVTSNGRTLRRSG